MTARPRPAHGTTLAHAEIRVLAGIARGRTDRQIAADLTITENTVGTLILRISSRLGTTTRGAAVAAGYQHGYLTALPAEPRPPVNLTPQQIDLLTDLAAGLTNEAVARRLWIQADTAKRRIGQVLAALAAVNRAHAVALAYQHGHLAADFQQHPLIGAAS